MKYTVDTATYAVIDRINSDVEKGKTDISIYAYMDHYKVLRELSFAERFDIWTLISSSTNIPSQPAAEDDGLDDWGNPISETSPEVSESEQVPEQVEQVPEQVEQVGGLPEISVADALPEIILPHIGPADFTLTDPMLCHMISMAQYAVSRREPVDNVLGSEINPQGLFPWELQCDRIEQHRGTLAGLLSALPDTIYSDVSFDPEDEFPELTLIDEDTYSLALGFDLDMQYPLSVWLLDSLSRYMSHVYALNVTPEREQPLADLIRGAAHRLGVWAGGYSGPILDEEGAGYYDRALRIIWTAKMLEAGAEYDEVFFDVFQNIP